MVLDKISPVPFSSSRKKQAGFRPGGSCNYLVSILRTIVEQSFEWNSLLYVIFVDFERAFDNIKHIFIQNTLKEKVISNKLSTYIIKIMQNIYSNALYSPVQRKNYLNI